MYRISYKNKLSNEVKILNNLIRKSRESILSLRISDLHSDFIINRVEKLTEDIKLKTNIVMDLEQKISNVDSGLLDDVIEQEIKKNQDVAIEKTKETKHKKSVIKSISLEDKSRMDIFISKEKTANRTNKYENKNYDSSYKYFCKISEKLPYNIRENLKNMPNNKGYIFKDSWFMGEKPNDKSGITLIFEKKYNEKNVLYIHEYTIGEHKIYKKIDKNNKFLFSTEKRRVIS